MNILKKNKAIASPKKHTYVMSVCGDNTENEYNVVKSKNSFG